MISRPQALKLLQSDDLIGVGHEADAIRKSLHPGGVVTYTLEQVLTDDGQAPEQILKTVQERVQAGATGIVFGAPRTGMRLDDCVSLMREIKSRHQSCSCGVSVREIVRLALSSGQAIGETVSRLKEAGMDVVARDHENSKAGIGQRDWADTHRAAHALGLQSTAEMVIREDDSLETRVAFLDQIRAMQEETRGFLAFALQPHGFETQEVSGVEYLKTLGVARMYLDNVPHVESDWSKVCLKVCQIGLTFGADDVGRANLAEGSDRTEDIRRIIRDAGFLPRERDALFRVYALS